jgi:hypothetical protein
MRRTATALTATLFTLGCGEGIPGPEVEGSSLLADLPTAEARGESKNFVSPLSGGQEVPPVETGGTGNAIFHLSPDATELDYKLISSNIEGVTQSHIHCGTPGVNGPVVVFLYGFNAAGVDPNGILAQGTITAGDVIPRADSGACPGGVADLDDVIEKLRTGGAYVNVHTLANPPGEIRGHVHEAGPSVR